MEKVLVIGGGASGMMAAIAAAGQGAEVTILEQNEQLGKKILSTGNGKCNFTNINQIPGAYRGEHPEFAQDVISRFPVPDTIRLFMELGLYSKNKDGYLYPHSEQASAVRDVLLMELRRLHVRIETSVCVEEIQKEGNSFRVKAVKSILKQEKKSKKRTVLVKTGEEEKVYQTGKLILTAGGLAGRVQKADGTGMRLAESFGHRVVPCVPALVQLKCRENFYPSLAGVRAGAKIELLCDGVVEALDIGEIQFTEYGISGIPVFQVSRFAARALEQKKTSVAAELDFMPEFTETQLESFFISRIQMRPEKTMNQFFTGIFHGKLAAVFLKRAGIPPELKVDRLGDQNRYRLAKIIKEFQTEITGTNGFEQAQVSAGGISTEEICPDTMESRLIPGLYFAGEIVDVDGMCGGYNLQWAWSSGHVAGISSAGKERPC